MKKETKKYIENLLRNRWHMLNFPDTLTEEEKILKICDELHLTELKEELTLTKEI